MHKHTQIEVMNETGNTQLKHDIETDMKLYAKLVNVC